MTPNLSRRQLLTRAGVIGCSLAASPFMTPVTFAQTPWDSRLVTIILRGGMDGLDVVQPYGDPSYAGLRPTLSGGPRQGSIDLDGFFSMNSALIHLFPLWNKGELAFYNAVSTPYRDKRSHFDGQDLLEAGTTRLRDGTRDGWLNRMLQNVPGVSVDTAYALGRDDLAILSGAAPVANWTPDAALRMSPQAKLLAGEIMKSDPGMDAAFAEAVLLAEKDPRPKGQKRRPPHIEIAQLAGRKLREDARIAAFSINGWDTHRRQGRSLPRALKRLSDCILTLKSTMKSDAWQKTIVVAVTEFGRTAAENGTRGTDHGTGGMMIFAGGALRGGQVYGDWPGLNEVDLFDRRDLMPTRDVRSILAWIMREQMGLSRAALEGHVFPGMELGQNPGLLL